MQVYVLFTEHRNEISLAGVVSRRELAERWSENVNAVTLGPPGRYIDFELDRVQWPRDAKQTGTTYP